MDPVCHTLAGAALGESGLKRRTPLGMAALLIGANLPDVDGAAYLTSSVSALAFRRGWTHGVLAMAVLPLLLVALLVAWDGLVRRRASPNAPRVRPRQLLVLSTAAVWSHPLLDWLNTYGVRFLMPFSGRWFYGDALFIVDLWVWLILGAGVIAARRRGPWMARGALGTLAVYAAVMWTGSAVVRAATGQAARTIPLAPVHRVMAAPVPLDPFARRLVVETDTAYRYGSARWIWPRRLSLGDRVVAKHDSLLRAVFWHPDARAFLRWSRFPLAVPSDGYVELRDARYPGAGGAWAGIRIPRTSSGDEHRVSTIAEPSHSAAVRGITYR